MTVFFRLLFFFLLAYAIYAAIKAYFTRRKAGSHTRHGHSAPDGEEMILDPQCQSYVPKAEAVFKDGNYFCSLECANLYLSR